MSTDMMMSTQKQLVKSEYVKPTIQIYQIPDIKIADINDFNVIEEMKKKCRSDRQIEFIGQSSSGRTTNSCKSWFYLNLFLMDIARRNRDGTV